MDCFALEAPADKWRVLASTQDVAGFKLPFSFRINDAYVGYLVQALWMLNGFIRFCPSPYYREIAAEVMEEYEEQS